jgi:GT2 family glycosyltransferase
MRISVVVPTYRRPELLARCLRALIAQDFPPSEFEILVCDDDASDETRLLVESLAAPTPTAIRYLPVEAAHGPAAARNVGWRAARGEVIAFTDDDTIPDTRWLAEGLASFKADPPPAAVAGRVVVPLPPEPTDHERNEAGLEVAEFVTANCFVRRDALEAVGGFDERFRAAWREDSDLHFSLLERGLPVALARDAVVVHPVRPAPWGVSLRQQRKSSFNALLYKKHPDLYRRRIRATPPWDYYATVGLLVAALAAGLSRVPVLAGVAASAWALLTARFCLRRLRATTRDPRHVTEMVVTSALIPPLSVFWRLVGAARFRVPFL